jgi:antitoxin (DNA-binding transcriptional repressor) of toxin-antitoxin stability system
LIGQLKPGEEFVITHGETPVAMVVLIAPLPPSPPLPPRQPGSGKHLLISWIDDDEHLKDFAEHMP